MAVTVNVQNNPNRSNAGTANGDATIISSGVVAATVEYQIRRRDRQATWNFITSTDYTTGYPQIVSISTTQLKIILPFRTELQARARESGGAWSNWANFKTRDKRYQSPDAITQVTDDGSLSSATRGNVTLNITNAGKGSVAYTAAGATVTNSDKWYNSTTAITYTAAGATITNSD